MSKPYGNPRRMDIAGLDFSGVTAVTPATRKPTLAERMFGKVWLVEAPTAEPDPYVWYSVADLIGGAR